MIVLKITLDKESFFGFRRIGIQGLSIIEFDDNDGPKPKYVYSKNAKLIRRILRDRMFSAKMSILAKYACEAIMNDNSRVIIEPFESIGDRIKTNYIVVQASPNANFSAIRSILKELRKRLNGSTSIDKSMIEKALKDVF